MDGSGAGKQKSRFASGERKRTRSKYGVGTVLPSNFTEEGAKRRNKYAVGPAKRVLTDAQVQRRLKAPPRIVRSKDVRVHSGPDDSGILAATVIPPLEIE